MARRKTTRSARTEQQPAAIRAIEQRTRPARFELRDSFDPALSFDGETNRNLNLERSLRSVALLMNALTEGGNKPLDAAVARGLSEALISCADFIGFVAHRNRYAGAVLHGV